MSFWRRIVDLLGDEARIRRFFQIGPFVVAAFAILGFWRNWFEWSDAAILMSLACLAATIYFTRVRKERHTESDRDEGV
ncbi:hypothetical protein [Phytohabitans kaempferiae]|uniref:Uncharacterized protein n=1 Tax=Phytohabitans kaempferiae TaxID=1620943 RepID=A0ABV6MCV3_9ACTN